MTYDYKCHILAGEFLDDIRSPKLNQNERALAQRLLAARIQAAIEEWIEEFTGEPPED